jgi:hypothetical protein
MPSSLDLRKDLYGPRLKYSPNAQLNMDVARVLEDAPSMTTEILFGAVNQLLGMIDEVTGLNFLDWAQFLENQFSPGNPTELLTKLTRWLNPQQALDLLESIFSPILNPDSTIQLPMIPLLPQSQVDGLEEALGDLGEAIVEGDIQGVIDAILKIVGYPPGTGTLPDLEKWSTDLSKMLALPDLSHGDFDAVKAVENFIANMLHPTKMLLDPGSPLDSFNLFNTLPSNVIGQVPVSVIGDMASNLLVNPTFEDLESIESTVWTWDAEKHSATGGSAKVIADGTGSKDLLSNLIQVTKDQVINVSVWVKWYALMGTATPIQLGITCYLNGSAVGQPIIAQLGVTPPTSDWRNLVGTYVIPANVDAIRMRMSVAPQATAGTVKWSDTWLSKSGLLPSLLVKGQEAGKTLADDLTKTANDIAAHASAIISRALQVDLDSLQQTLSPSGALEDIAARMNSFLDSLSPLNGSNINAGSVADSFVPGVLTTYTNIVTQLLQTTIQGSASSTASADALLHVSDVLAGLTSQVEKLTVQSTSGKTAFDDFERPASSNLGPNWQVSYPGGGAGTIGTDGHNASFSKSGLSQRIYVCRYLPLVCDGDMQTWSVALGGAPENPLLSGLTGNPAMNDVNGRMSSDMLNFIRFRIWAGRAWLNRIVNGIEQTMLDQPYNGPSLGAGSSLTLVCGKGGNARYFVGRVNGSDVIQVGETGTASMLGPQYRFGGFGGLAGSWPVLLTQTAPGDVRMWSGGDQ